MIQLVFVIALFLGIFVLASNSLIISLIGLITLFIDIAVFLVLSDFDYIALVYIIVYVGAIAILFIFVLMMLSDKDDLSHENNYSGISLMIICSFIKTFIWLSPKSTLAPILAFFNYYIIPTNVINNIFNPNLFDITLLDIVQSLGFIMYTFGAMWLITVGLILLLAIVGPIMLILNPNKHNKNKS